MKRFLWVTQCSFLSLTSVCLTIAFLLAPTATAQTNNNLINRSVTPSLGDAIDADGKIKKGVVGGFSAAGFEMKIDENGAPRFVQSDINNTGELKTNLSPLAAPNTESQSQIATTPVGSPTPSRGVLCRVGADRRYFMSGAQDDESFYEFATIAAIAVDANGNLFIGGRFTLVGNIVAHHIVRYNTVTDTWSALAGSGLNSDFTPYIYVNALAISGNDLFVGGRFTRTYDGSTTNLNGIARYDIAADVWSPLAGNGLNGIVHALAVSGNNLYVGGEIFETFDGSVPNLKYVARYDTTANIWSALAGEGLDNTVYSLAISGNDLYVGGAFTQSFSGATTNLNRIARYNLTNNTWSQLAGNGLSGNGFTVRVLLVSGSELFVGGSFSQTADGSMTNLHNIARYNISNNVWSPLAGGGLNETVYSLAISSGNLYVGGQFSQTFDGATVNLNRIARYNTSNNAWSASNDNGLSGNAVYAIIAINDDLFVGGYFNRPVGGTTENVNNIARYKISPGGWASVGATLHTARGIGLSDSIRAIAVANNGDIFVGGFFTETLSGSTNLSRIARYNRATNTWAPLAGNGLNNTVLSMAIAGDTLFVGGNFTATADGATTNLNGIARYNILTNNWSPMAGNGLDADVTALLISGNHLYVSGFFSRTFNGATANLNHIARYDIAADTWSGFAEGGLDAPVSSLAVSGGNLFVGGSFTKTFDGATTNLNRIARFNFSTNDWSALAGDGLNAPVNALAVRDDVLFVGGFFTQTFDGATTNLNYIARYSIPLNLWSSLSGNSLNNTVYALAISGDILFAGGAFTQTSNGLVTARHVARYEVVNDRWSLATIGVNDTVYALAFSGTDLIMGGIFTQIAGCGVSHYYARQYLQTWNGAAFSGRLAGAEANWFDGSNWATGTAPADNTNAVIPVGAGDIGIRTGDVTMNDLLLHGGTLIVGAGRTLTINGTLDLGGKITGAGTVVIAGCNPDSIINEDATAYIQTTLVRCVNNTGTFNFPVGTTNGYSSATVKNIAGNSTITARVFQTNQPDLNPATSLRRYWTLTAGNPVIADLIFKYLDADISGNENAARITRVAGGVPTVFANNCAAVSPCVNPTANTATIKGVTEFSDWTLSHIAPTAASVSVAGRVLNLNGKGIMGARVSIIDTNGNTRNAVTNFYGFYRFTEIPSGQTYVIAVQSKRHQFSQPTQVLFVGEDLINVNFVASS